ncbi:MAG: ABATE domain-containing protein [Chloroflexota bacterium]|nr:ABATE domain-containing protein [Chloroflexota bacterium]
MVEAEIQTQKNEVADRKLCLDFINTLDERSSDLPRELLKSYSDLVAWSQQKQILTDEEAQSLLEKQARHPAGAIKVLERAVALREAMYRIFSSVAEDSVPTDNDLALLNRAFIEAMAQTRLVLNSDTFVREWSGKEDALDRMLWPVVRSAVNLLTSEHLHTVRVCASDDCKWLFLDTSKNGSRRWCDMKSCGNRAKARRHYSQKKQTSEA